MTISWIYLHGNFSKCLNKITVQAIKGSKFVKMGKKGCVWKKKKQHWQKYKYWYPNLNKATPNTQIAATDCLIQAINCINTNLVQNDGTVQM